MFKTNRILKHIRSVYHQSGNSFKYCDWTDNKIFSEIQSDGVGCIIYGINDSFLWSIDSNSLIVFENRNVVQIKFAHYNIETSLYVLKRLSKSFHRPASSRCGNI